MGDSQNSYLSTNPSTIIIVHICFIVKGKQLILFIFSQLCSLLLYIITITHLHPKGTVHILSHHCTAISQNCNTGLSKHSNISPTFYVHLFVFHATIRPFPNFPTSPLLLFSLQHAPICTRTYLRQSFFSTHKHTYAYCNYNSIGRKCKEHYCKFSEIPENRLFQLYILHNASF